MIKLLHSLLLAFCIFCLSSASEIDVPKCIGGSNDPATGSPCTPYSYDETWIVKTMVKTDGNKYITVNEGKGAGDVWPPPTVNVTVNTRIRIRIDNQLSDGEEVTLHFHGILQKNGYVTMDGPQGITQSPVRSGEKFTYDFPVTQAGTFWIHSHATGQYPKGLRSPLIITDATEPALMGYDTAYDFTFTVSDWWNNFWTTLAQYNSDPSNCKLKGVEIPPLDHIVNDNCQAWGHGLSNGDLAKYIPAGKTARVRFINMSAFARYYIHLDTRNSNDMTVVEIDGVRVKPVSTMGIELASGQRVSVLIKGAAANSVSRKIIFVSDPRISIPNRQPNTPDYCGATYPDVPTGAPSANVQYAWAWLDSVATSPTRNVPAKDDMQYSGYNRVDYLTWTDADTYGKPYYSGRPRMDYAYQTRTVDGQQLWIPDYAYNFNEFAFEPLDSEPAWMIAANEVNSDFIHNILLAGDDGYGAMVRRLPGQSAVPIDRFPPVETPYDPSQANSGFQRPHTLMQALRSINGDGTVTPKAYVKPVTYTHADTVPGAEWAHTIVLPEGGEVHWFVLRSKMGDHPFHMHGHEFQLLAKLPVPVRADNGNPYDFDFSTQTNYLNNLFTSVNTLRGGSSSKKPARRDTLMIEKGWDYVIAIKTDNPGTWAMHCHNDFHADTRMFMQLIENPKALRQSLGVWDVGQQNQGTCGSCFQPWISRSGSTSVNNGLGGIVWGQVAQNLRASMQYYGCPDTCYQYYYSPISVRRHARDWVDAEAS